MDSVLNLNDIDAEAARILAALDFTVPTQPVKIKDCIPYKSKSGSRYSILSTKDPLHIYLVNYPFNVTSKSYAIQQTVKSTGRISELQLEALKMGVQQSKRAKGISGFDLEDSSCYY